MHTDNMTWHSRGWQAMYAHDVLHHIGDIIEQRNWVGQQRLQVCNTAGKMERACLVAGCESDECMPGCGGIYAYLCERGLVAVFKTCLQFWNIYVHVCKGWPKRYVLEYVIHVNICITSPVFDRKVIYLCCELLVYVCNGVRMQNTQACCMPSLSTFRT